MQTLNTNISLELPSPVQRVSEPLFSKKGIEFFLKREDLIHPSLGGNKWRKLKPNLHRARKQEKPYLLTFGGAFSNHISATAAAGKYFSFQTIGLIRGEETSAPNPTLDFARSCGMQLKFVSRSEYRLKHRPEFLDQWLEWPREQLYLIPEGGTNLLAVRGAREIAREWYQQHPDWLPDFWCLPVGTGGTMSGLIWELEGRAHVVGFSALKGDFLQKEIHKLVPEALGNWTIEQRYHFGGFAKWTPELIDFIRNFHHRHGVKLDPLYTGKMMFGLYRMIENGYFPQGSRILAIHTGGIQGIRGFEQRFGLELFP